MQSASEPDPYDQERSAFLSRREECGTSSFQTHVNARGELHLPLKHMYTQRVRYIFLPNIWNKENL